MQKLDIKALRKRAFQYTRKRDLVRYFQRETSWTDQQQYRVLKHRHDLIMAKRGLHRKTRHDPASSHEQFIQVMLIIDQFRDYRTSCLAWSHDMRDDFLWYFGGVALRHKYGPDRASDIDALSRDPAWKVLPFRDEVAASDARIRTGGTHPMRVKPYDRMHSDLNWLTVKTARRRRKSGMKVWQSHNSILLLARDVGVPTRRIEQMELLVKQQQERLGYTARELDTLVLRPLNDP